MCMGGGEGDSRHTDHVMHIEGEGGERERGMKERGLDGGKEHDIREGMTEEWMKNDVSKY